MEIDEPARAPDSTRYTVIGGIRNPDPDSPHSLSAVILGRKERSFPVALVESLIRAGFPSILYLTVSIEPGMAEAKTRALRELRVMLVAADASPGAMVNCAMKESTGKRVLVLWSDMALRESGFSSRFYEKLSDSGLPYAIPRMFDPAGDELPLACRPQFEGRELSPKRSVAGDAGAFTLYPVEFAGFFLRSAFLSSGGYDTEFSSPYWESVDFGFRSWLRGESMKILPSFELLTSSIPRIEDRGGRGNVARFWLKNLAPVYKGGHVALAADSALGFLIRRRGNPLRALREYRILAAWLRDHAFRFTTDARGLVETWGEFIRT
jgi:hypothetical protein